MKLKKLLVALVVSVLMVGTLVACNSKSDANDYYLISGTMNNWLTDSKEQSYVLNKNKEGGYELQNVKLVKNTQFTLLKNGVKDSEQLTYSYYDEAGSTPNVVANGKGESTLDNFRVKEDGYYNLKVTVNGSARRVVVERAKENDESYMFDHAASDDGIDFTKESERILRFNDDGDNVHQYAIFNGVEGTSWYAQATFVYKGRTETFKDHFDGRAGIVSLSKDHTKKVAYTMIYDMDERNKDLKITEWLNNDWNGQKDKNRWIQDRKYRSEATIGLLRQGTKFYMFYNGACVELDGVYAYDGSDSVGADEVTVPAIYSAKTVLEIKNVFATSNCDTCPIFQEKLTMTKGEAISSNDTFTQYGNAAIAEDSVTFNSGTLGGKIYQNYAKYNKTLKGDFTVEFDVKDMNFFTSGGWMWSKVGISLVNGSGTIDRLTICVHNDPIARRFQLNLGGKNLSFASNREGAWGDYTSFGDDWNYKGEHKVKIERKSGIYHVFMDGVEYFRDSDTDMRYDENGRAKSSFTDSEELTLTFDTEFAKGSISNIKITTGE